MNVHEMEEARVKALSEFTGVPVDEIEKDWKNFYRADHKKYLVTTKRELDSEDFYELVRKYRMEDFADAIPETVVDFFRELPADRIDLINRYVELGDFESEEEAEREASLMSDEDLFDAVYGGEPDVWDVIPDDSESYVGKFVDFIDPEEVFDILFDADYVEADGQEFIIVEV